MAAAASFLESTEDDPTACQTEVKVLSNLVDQSTCADAQGAMLGALPSTTTAPRSAS